MIIFALIWFFFGGIYIGLAIRDTESYGEKIISFKALIFYLFIFIAWPIGFVEEIWEIFRKFIK